MQVTVKMDIQNCPKNLIPGYEVVTNDNGTLWHYGLYPDEASAQEAVDEFPEMRFMVEVAE